MANVGENDITYTFIDTNGCSNSFTLTTMVYTSVSVGFSGLNSPYCINHIPIPLVGSTNDGIFTGAGIFNSDTTTTFDPSIAGVGTHIISFRSNNINGTKVKFPIL